MTDSFEEKLKLNFGAYPDFPKKGILFRDVLTVLRDPDLFQELIDRIANFEIVIGSEALVAIDARGFIFGSALSYYLKKPLIFARKPGKLPGEIISSSYDLEYGSNTLCIQKSCIEKYNNFCIVDDLLATGGTAACVESMLTGQNKNVTGLVVVVELAELLGRKKLKSQVESVVTF